MKNAIKLILGIVLLSVVLLAPGNAPGSQQEKKDQKGVTETNPSGEAPDLADIIPLAAALTGNLANLENKLNQLADLTVIEKEYKAIGAELKEYRLKYKQIKDRSIYNTANIYEIRREVENRKSLLEAVSGPLREEINRVDSWKIQWLGGEETLGFLAINSAKGSSARTT